ncbi:9982_t:CDS:1 [Acaulospora colombiana]|uniref:9982_t:CDS:1 n=1 Tax=Acaulospora colombiana TaxID=27376 RepID=A0ACA9MRT9_9GLOM|nr:9982_t:CDS:1 [Acaulospora colombiana]
MSTQEQTSYPGNKLICQLQGFLRDGGEFCNVDEQCNQFGEKYIETRDDHNFVGDIERVSRHFRIPEGLNPNFPEESQYTAALRSELSVDGDNSNYFHSESPFYPILMSLFDLRDNLYLLDKNYILSRASELIIEVESLSTIEGTSDSYIRHLITILAHQISEICDKQVESTNSLLERNSDAIQKLTNAFRDNTQQSQLSDSSVSLPATDNSENPRKTSTRNRMDPFATLWCIKYLLDNNLQKPNKKQRYLLSLWTNVPVHDIDRWFIRTNINYIKTNDEGTARKRLSERAKTISKQLRRDAATTNAKKQVPKA